MGSWPFTRLHYGCNRCIAIAGPHIQVLDAISGEILHARCCPSNIICSAVDAAYSWLVASREDKWLDIWSLQTLELQSSRELPKRATVVQLSHDAQTIIVADKFGDVFSYPRLPPPDAPVPEPKRREATASHVTPHGSLVLGHASIITALLLSHDGRYIVTADRDEHIRVSRYPHGHIIERYCLGHRLFLSALCMPSFEPTTLVSGGGDPCLYLWDWMAGTLRCEITIADVVRPFLRVRESKPRWHGGNDGGRKGRRRGRKARKDDGQPDAAEHADEIVAMEVADGEEYKKTNGVSSRGTEAVFALAKIEAIDLNGERVLVFSAFGASALFYCSYPSRVTDVPSVQHIEFERPVLDFVVGDRSHILVSLDTGWTPPLDTSGRNPAVTLLSWQNSELVLCTETWPLVDVLNGTASLDASAPDLAPLELYAALALLPKHADGGEDGEGEQDKDSRPSTPSRRSKVAGRLQTKQTLLRQQEQEQEQAQEHAEKEQPKPKKIKLGDEM